MRFRVSPIYSLWFLLLVAMLIFVGISFSDDIKIGGHTLKKASFRETLTASAEYQDADSLFYQDASLIFETDSVKVNPPDTTVHSVLIFGDSMTHNLAMSISKYGTKNNYKVTGVTWESSSIPGWSSSGKIKEYIGMSKPDFIIISLGSNEMELKNFDRRIPDVKNIVSQLDSIPFIWVGPPLWKTDKGVYEMLGKALPKGTLYKVDGSVIPRGGDHVHPTRLGADIWADSLMVWIKNSYHPILAEKPDSGTTTKGHKFIYLHPED